MSDYFDELETRAPEAREAAHFEQLRQFLADIQKTCPGWKTRLKDIACDTITSREALAAIPMLRKDDLMAAQAKAPPFGGFADEAALDGTRIFVSPGPVFEPQSPPIDPALDIWQGARAFHAAGIGKGDVVHCALSYHMTPGGMILDEGARAAGAQIFPAGVGNTEQQIEAAAFLKPTAYAGTPDYLKTLLDKADEAGKDLSSITKALVSGGALFPSMREEYAARGVNVLQCYATADLGVIAYETMSDGKANPGMVVNEGFIVEIVRPGSDDPVAPGEVGELVVTNFNPAYPLIRFGTGDLSCVLDETSPCGRTNMRIKGWMGRADQRTKIKGMFVDPKQIDQLVKSVDGVARARLSVERKADSDTMTLEVEAENGAKPDIAQIEAELTAITKLKGKAKLTDQLPNDGKVIDDKRDYSK